MRRLATLSLIFITIVVASVYLPMLYGKVFFERVEKTHLLFSPVTERFIYKEKIIGPIPVAARNKAEDHHAEIAYHDADGTYYSRVEFEKKLPFIYYKNMELWGLMPLRLGGETFDKKAIKADRQVLELKSVEIDGQNPESRIWPLLESNPGQARLMFPEDRFRMTADAMQFVNTEANHVDMRLTKDFTRVLKKAGFTFPARSVNGKFTILKPFDEGVFLVDADYRVFHVKRRDNRPEVIQTPIDPALKTKHIKVLENKRRKYVGLLLAGDDSLHLLTYDNYRLIRLPLEHYDPNRMDFKLIVNSLYRTAVWSDETTIRAVAMDRDFRVLDRYTHRMSRATLTTAHRVYQAVFPFAFCMESKDGGFLRLSFKLGGWLSLIGIGICFIGYVSWVGFRRKRLPGTAALLLVALTGIYGWLALEVSGEH